MNRQRDLARVDDDILADFDQRYYSAFEGDGMPFDRVPMWVVECDEGIVWVQWVKAKGKPAVFALTFKKSGQRLNVHEDVAIPKPRNKPFNLNNTERVALRAAITRFGWHELDT
jgi:hypothetical protein